MRNKLSAIPISVVLLISCSEEIPSSQVPSLVLNVATDKYNSNQIEWEKNGSLYEAEIEVNDSTEISLQINEAGKLVMEKQDIPKNLVPANILTKIEREFSGFQLHDVEKVEKDSRLYYQFELKSNGKEFNLVFNEDGNEEKTVKYWN